MATKNAFFVTQLIFTLSNEVTHTTEFTSEYWEREGIKVPPEKIMHFVELIWPNVPFEHATMSYEGTGGVNTTGGSFPSDGYVKEPMGWLVYQTADKVTPYSDGSVRVTEETRRLLRRAPVS
jgi:hypothetical protein